MHDTRSVPELPQLTEGVHLLETSQRAVGPLHALVLDHLLLEGGHAVWIDANGYGTSMHLADVAPSTRVLDRVHIARGFTAYQHQALVQDAVEPIDDDTSLVVAPAVDALYRADDIRGAEPQTLLLQSLSRLARYARDSGLPVLTTRTTADDFSDPVARLADGVIEVEQTTFGPRFRGSDFETLVYAENGPTMQTTLTYWARILGARQALHEEGTTNQPTTRVSH
ncbi:hypothetical protein [Halodesulfurarchaeum sp.]|uniref:hypothetical protein n=1 Tax=Halodesulfurarchaeum sp. TaxID=1980530 RepID=UPI002FC2ED81